MRSKRWQKGMTLIELLVAITILAVITVMGAMGLDSMVRARSALNEEMDDFHGIQLSFAQLQNDCTRLADADEVQSHQLVLADDNRIVLLRRVSTTEEALQYAVVLYRVADGKLTRQELPASREMADIERAWQAALNNPPQDGLVTLQEHVRELQVRTWQADGWQSGGGARRSRTKAIEVLLRTRSHDTGLVKIFLLGAA